MTKNIKNGCLAMYDITIKNDTNDRYDIFTFFKTHCKRWVFQLEKGTETGYLHYQCRISLWVKKRFTTMTHLLDDCNINDYYLSPTCTTTYRGNDFFYAMKDDTRVEGPWTDLTYKDICDIDPFYKTIQWLPWQTTMMDFLKEEANRRIINVLFNKRGDKGKSTLVRYLGYMGLVERIPTINNAKDILQMVCCVTLESPKDAYIVDMPRATNIAKYTEMFAALETVKDGFAFDIRNKYKRVYFKIPHIWVFCNDIPNLHQLTYNRWRFWDVVDDVLVNITDEVINNNLPAQSSSKNKIKLVVKSPRIDVSGKLDATIRADN